MQTDELIFAEDLPPATISGRVKRGDLRRIATGVYTTDLKSPLDAVVRKHAFAIAGRLYPNAVITDRSAPTGGVAGGYLYLAHPARRRETVLPGLTISARTGQGPLPDDVELPGGLHQASRARRWRRTPSRRAPPRARRAAPSTAASSKRGSIASAAPKARNAWPSTANTPRQSLSRSARAPTMSPVCLRRSASLSGPARHASPPMPWRRARRADRTTSSECHASTVS